MDLHRLIQNINVADFVNMNPAASFDTSKTVTQMWDGDTMMERWPENMSASDFLMHMKNQAKCRAVVYWGKERSDALFCGRTVASRTLKNNDVAAQTFCPFHVYCDQKLVGGTRCNRLRSRYMKNAAKNAVGSYGDIQFSRFCNVHQSQGLDEKCLLRYKKYKEVCAKTNTCDEIESCFNARQIHKNMCNPYTEDNGHYLHRRKLGDQLRNKCKRTLRGDTVLTMPQPFIIDYINDNLMSPQKMETSHNI